jgi:cobalt/nickel transport system permease protein
VAGSHVHALYRHGASFLHHTRPEVKLAATFLFVFAVVATPREAVWAFGIYAAGLLSLAAAAGLTPRFILPRMAVEVPFLVLALLFPFFGGGERIDVIGLSLSRGGLWDAWNILAKATLGLFASVVMAGTTPVAAILEGLDRLRVPRAMTGIMGFMIRYLDVVAGEFRRMRIAMASRGYDPRWIWQGRAAATSAGALFVRSYERGERVYLAMASRGYTGVMPRLEHGDAPTGQWIAAAAVVAAAWSVAVTALVAT